MPKLPAVSLPTLLGLIIGTIGCLLVRQSVDGVLQAYRVDRQAAHIAALSQANAPLSSTMTGERTRRSKISDALQAEPPVDEARFAAILENRRRGESNIAETFRRLAQIDHPGVSAAAAKLRIAHNALLSRLPQIDTALHLPKSQRDPLIISEQPIVLNNFNQAVMATNDALESAMQLVDPVVDQLISLRQASRTMRGAAGAVQAVIEHAIRSGRPFTLTDLDLLAAEHVPIELAWTTIKEAAARGDAPADLLAAIEATERGYFGFVSGIQRDWIQTLRFGAILSVPLPEFERVQTEALLPIVGIADTAMQDLMRRTAKVSAHARLELSLNAVALVITVIFSILGAMIAHSRISRPIRQLTNAMGALSAGETGVALPVLGHADEISAMCDALRVFRDEINRAAQLSALTLAQKQAEEDQKKALHNELEAMSAAQGEVVETMVFGLMQLTEGDLTFTLPLPLAPEYEMLRTMFNDAVTGLHATVRDVLERSDTLGISTKEIAQAATDLATRTEQQAVRLQQTTGAVAEITANVQATAAGSTGAQRLAEAAQADAERSAVVLRETVQAMTEIDNSARQIGQVIGLIDDVAFQTNLLALNAGIEAAKSGEAGRGFAVVASEVRALAKRAALAATEIKTLIGLSTENVASGVQLVGETSQALARIQAAVADITSAVREIAEAAAGQSAGLAEVNVVVAQMDQSTQQNAAMVEQSTAATHSLAQETAALATAMARFKLQANTPELCAA